MKAEFEPSGIPTISCPKCGGEMIEEDHGAVYVDRCLDCQALWLDSKEINAMIGQSRADSASGVFPSAVRRKVPATTPTRCPRCDIESLRSWQWRDLPYELCYSCGGVYLDSATRDSMIAEYTSHPFPSAPDLQEADLPPYLLPDSWIR